MRSTPLVVAALLLAACARPSVAPPAVVPSSVSLVPVHTDTAAFRADAQAIVHAFAAEVARARGASLGDAPTAHVRTTPQLIFFSPAANQVVVPWWDAQPPGMRATFRTFAGGGDAEAEHLFRAFFNRFLIAHEAGHWFQARAGRREPTLYENENMANRLAVAFWRTQPGGEAFLAELERLATEAAANLPDPTPPGEDAVAYFGANYQALGGDPIKYGYYQFRFMRDALRERARLDFGRMVADTLRAYPPTRTVDVIDDYHGTRVADGRELPDVLEGMLWAAPVWTRDGEGFFYVRYRRPAPGARTTFHSPAVHHHRVGTPQADDPAIFRTPEGTSHLAVPESTAVLEIRPGPGEDELDLATMSLLRPPGVTRHDLRRGTSRVVRAPSVPFDTAAFVARQVWYRSADGTRVPMFLVHRRGIALDGSHPTLLFGYGASGQATLPAYGKPVIAWLELGGIVAAPNLRGGGEFGRAW